MKKLAIRDIFNILLVDRINELTDRTKVGSLRFEQIQSIVSPFGRQLVARSNPVQAIQPIDFHFQSTDLGA